ncbi:MULTISPECIES: PrpF domain-containing protein [Frankia]|nr:MULTISPECIES: PrpF domain-containing protein [Frankia]
MALSTATAIPLVLMRGGTSKGVFVTDDALPGAGPERDRAILALLGSPDPMQLDGLGGTHSSTSKVVLVRPSEHPGCDIDYLFVQVGIDRPIVDYAGNCGNLTAAAAVYALEEGLLAGDARPGLVRMFNRNLGQRIDALVPAPPTRGVGPDAVGPEGDRPDAVGPEGDGPEGDGPDRDGREGDWREEARLAGMPTTGLAVLTEYLDPAGPVTGALLPTGRPRDVLTPSVGGPIEVSLVDLAAPIVFVRAADLGLRGDEAPAALNARPGLLARLESIRAAGAARMGLASDEAAAAVDSPVLPRLTIVSPPPPSADLVVRATSLGRAHHACPITTALCAAAAARTAGTLPFAYARVATDTHTTDTDTHTTDTDTDAADTDAGTTAPGTTASDAAGPETVRIAHPRGTLTVTVRTSDRAGREIVAVGVLRTARRLLAGTAYLPG